jgi:hypothetical protein
MVTRSLIGNVEFFDAVSRLMDGCLLCIHSGTGHMYIFVFMYTQWHGSYVHICCVYTVARVICTYLLCIHSGTGHMYIFAVYTQWHGSYVHICCAYTVARVICTYLWVSRPIKMLYLHDSILDV